MKHIRRWWQKRFTRHYQPYRCTLSHPVRDVLRRMPKVEIHLHLEGSMDADTILALSQKYRHPQIRTRQDAQWALFFHSPRHFFQRFLSVSSLLREAEDFKRLARQVARRFIAEHIRYAEITFAPHKFVRNGIPYPAMIEAIDAGIREEMQDRPFDYGIIIDIVRDLGPEAGMETLRMVEAHPHPRVVAVGLGGGEGYPAEASKEVFAFAETLRLQKTAHAGEGRGPDSIWGAIQHLGVHRIDHGLRAIEDERLVNDLAEHQIHLNMCLTSNVMLGVAKSYHEHPLQVYHQRRIPVNLSTDDPAFFQTTLTQEFEKALQYQPISLSDCAAFLSNAIEASFLDDEKKARMKQQFLDEFQSLLNSIDTTIDTAVEA